MFANSFTFVHLQVVTTSLRKHLERKHTDVFKLFKKEVKEMQERADKNPLKSSKNSVELSQLKQKKLTEFSKISKVMMLAANLAVHNGYSFKSFNCNDMTELLNGAKKGLNDTSSEVINSENIKSAIKELAAAKRGEMLKLMQNKLICISADFATCERRSFLGNEFYLINPKKCSCYQFLHRCQCSFFRSRS